MSKVVEVVVDDKKLLSVLLWLITSDKKLMECETGEPGWRFLRLEGNTDLSQNDQMDILVI